MDDCHLYYITRLKRKTVPELTYNVALNTNNLVYWLDDYKYNTYSKVYMMPRNKAMSVPSAIEYNFASRNGQEI